eukprot:gene2954-24060_t
MLHEMAAHLSRISGTEATVTRTEVLTPHADGKVQPRWAPSILWKGQHIPLLTPEQWTVRPSGEGPAINVAGAYHTELAGFLSEKGMPNMGQLLSCWSCVAADYLYE